MSLSDTVRNLLSDPRIRLPPPGSGNTPLRHRYLADIARHDLELGRLLEAHMDATAILREAGREPVADALYAVWAAESPGKTLSLNGKRLSGTKVFCTGATIVDHALVTVTKPQRELVEVDLRAAANDISYDESDWVTSAFPGTHTATAVFNQLPVERHDFIASPDWYLDRPGFWHGACGPASCWTGGALGLVDYAIAHARESDPHAMAHLGAMKAIAWGLQSVLEISGQEIDQNPGDAGAAMTRALMVRHLIEEGCTEILGRFGRAFGPRPLAFDKDISRRCVELTLYIRQSHAEHDLEKLGLRVRES